MLYGQGNHSLHGVGVCRVNLGRQTLVDRVRGKRLALLGNLCNTVVEISEKNALDTGLGKGKGDFSPDSTGRLNKTRTIISFPAGGCLGGQDY
jgi:hypothetical protein